MISTFWTPAPADVFGRGFVVRPSLLPAVAADQGSGLSIAGTAPRHRGSVTRTGFAFQLPCGTTHDDTRNDGTTLGNHSSGRPL